jgi:hypothetical protein
MFVSCTVRALSRPLPVPVTCAVACGFVQQHPVWAPKGDAWCLQPPGEATALWGVRGQSLHGLRAFSFFSVPVSTSCMCFVAAFVNETFFYF